MDSAKTMSASVRLFCVAAAAVFVAGCGSTTRPSPEPPALIAPAPPASDFRIAAGMLDTWNAVGQILVNADGVTYQGRAQMLGLYDVRFRGERFLVLTRAMTLTGADQGMTTKVSVALQDGKPDDSAAAIELLGVLQARLPEELRLIAAGKLGKPRHAKR